MKKLVGIAILAACLAPTGLCAQTPSTQDPTADMPSDSEISDLTSKAFDKVTEFQKTLDIVKPYLDKVGPTLYKNDSAAASNALLIIAALKKNGATAYALTSLLTTLDDLTLDASQASTQMVLLEMTEASNGRPAPDGIGTAVVMMSSAGNGCYDISELIMHSTLRFIDGEEKMLRAISESLKK